MTRTEGDIWLYHQFWPWGQFSRSNEGKTLFLNEISYFWLRIWKERKISRQKLPAEKWFLWLWKGKKLRSNVWETTRYPFPELSWFFGVNKRSRCFKKVNEMLRCTSPWPSWTSGNFQGDLKVKTIFLRLNSVPETWEARGTHNKKAPQRKQTQVNIFKSFIWDTRKFSFSISEDLLRKTCKVFRRNVMLCHLSY